ncbi:MAG: PAS domain-containing protein [Planctomycetales bacterium]|nr:PAS domain-containing protein [Planctomycetales bacterium]
MSNRSDIPEPNKSARRLGTREERVRALTSADSGVVVYRISPDWSEMWQLDGGEFNPDSSIPTRVWLETSIPPEEQPRILATIRRAIDAKRVFELEHLAIRIDGTLGWTRSQAVPILNEQSEIVEWLGAATDITRRKQLQRDVLVATEEELRRIGRDLRDGAQQELAGLEMLARTLFESLTSAAAGSCLEIDKHRAMAWKVVAGIDRAHRAVQLLSNGSVTVQLEQQGLVLALQKLAFRTDEVDGITCAFKCEQPRDFADIWMAAHLFRIAQAAVDNALRHAHPEHILIALDCGDSDLTLQVADDGDGFDPMAPSEGTGLPTMLYRAGLIGASLTVTRVETGGTLVTCTLPLSGRLPP